VWRDRTLDAVTLCTLGGVAALRLSAAAASSRVPAAAAPHRLSPPRPGRGRVQLLFVVIREHCVGEEKQSTITCQFAIENSNRRTDSMVDCNSSIFDKRNTDSCGLRFVTVSEIGRSSPDGLVLLVAAGTATHGQRQVEVAREVPHERTVLLIRDALRAKDGGLREHSDGGGL